MVRATKVRAQSRKSNPVRRAVGFGGLEKRTLSVDLPVRLWDRFEDESWNNRTSKGMLMAEILCRHFGIAPSEFGIVVDQTQS